MGSSTLMQIIGSAVAPAVIGMYMQADQSMLKINRIAQYFPSGESYNLTSNIIHIPRSLVKKNHRNAYTKSQIKWPDHILNYKYLVIALGSEKFGAACDLLIQNLMIEWLY